MTINLSDLLQKHSNLVETAIKYLKQVHCVIVTEIRGNSFEAPDAIGWTFTGSSTLIECKRTYEDFKIDQIKFSRLFPENGMGQRRYYLSYEGIIPEKELPKGWGLLVLKGKRIVEIKEGRKFEQFNHQNECAILVSTIRRIGQNAPENMKIDYFIDNKIDRSFLSIQKD